MKKRITILELIVIIVILSVFALILSPRFTYTTKQRQEATVRANLSIAVSAINSVFALKTEENMTKTAVLIADTLNKSTKNPLIKNADAYTINNPSTGAVDFVADDSRDFIVINAYTQNTKTPLITMVVRKNK